MNTMIAMPIHHGTYTNKSDVRDVEFLQRVMRSFHSIFINLCYNCNGMEGTSMQAETAATQRCSGCQLVAYCSKVCQKADWPTHKYVCKEFPMVNGKNVLHTVGSFDERLKELSRRAARLPKSKISTMTIFRNPRVCFTCKESRPDELTDCECSSASYCSEKCAKADKEHKEDCDRKWRVKKFYFLCCLPEPPSLRDVSVCEYFTLVSCWSDIIVSPLLEVAEDHPKMPMYIDRLSYPISLLYNLQSLPERRLGSDHSQLEDLTSLEIHALISTPLLDSEPWEVLMHHLPKLKRLKVVFVVQQRAAHLMFNLNNTLRLQRCKSCEANNRVITYAVRNMQYHMFFSSSGYTTPDVVVIYGNTTEMAAVEEDDIHQELSYCNITYSSNTVLVLTDDTKDKVSKGIEAVNTARPVEQIVSPQINPLFGFSKNHELKLSATPAEQNLQCTTNKIFNDKYYFACLRRK